MNQFLKFLKKLFQNLPGSISAKNPVSIINDFQLLVAGVKDYAIITLGLDGHMTSWNSGAEEMIGYKAGEAIGKSFEIVYDNDAVSSGIPWKNLELVKLHGRVEKDAWRLRKDGTGFWANIVFTARTDAAGELCGYLIIARDITETKKAHEQIELFSRQIDQSNDSIFTVDADFKITRWNLGAEKLYGYTSQEALGKVPNELLATNITHEDLSVALDVINETGYWTGELKRKTKTGNFIDVHSSTSCLRDEAGKLTGYIGVSFDITAQKKLQEQVNHLASIVEQSMDAINSTTLDGVILTWNGGAEKLFGYSKQEAIGKTAKEMGVTDLPDEDIVSFFQLVVEKGSTTSEIKLFRKDRTSFFGASTASIVKDIKGEVSTVVFVVKDITLRKKLEEELEISNEGLEQKVKERTAEIYTSEKRFRALVENNHGIITLLDKNIKPFYRSPMAERITGWTMEERQSSSLLDQAHPEDLPVLAAVMEKVMETPGKTFFYTTRSKHKDGHYLWFEAATTNMLHDPAVAGIISNLLDVTERKNNEDAKRKTEILYRNLFENMLHGFAYCKAIFKDGGLTDFLYITVNTAYEVMTGFKNINGKKVSEVMPGLFESEPAYIEILQSISLTGHAEKFEAYVKPLDKWYAVSIYSPEKGYFIMLSDDITTRKKTEEAIRKSEVLYRSLFENMLHGFAWCRPVFENNILTDVEYTVVNSEYELMTGFKNVAGRKLSEIMPGLLASDPEFTKRITNVLSTGNPEKFESRIEFLSKWYVSSVYSPDKESFVLLVDDISAQKESELKIIKLNAELEERVLLRTEQLRKTNEELEAFSYSVSHDLRAPLRGIMGFTSILEEEYGKLPGDEAERIIAVIKSNTVRMGHLIDDLLSFSRMSRQDIIQTGVDTNEMVQEIIAEAELQKNRGQNIEWIVHPLPGIKADINTIRQVWVNLISNAVKYSGKTDAPRIEIGSFTRHSEIIFFVKDNGTGFDEKYINKLFRVFQRLHSQDEFEGSGIGLAIVEKIISKHNGKVWAEAAVNKGASFYFSLPASSHANNINHEIYKK